MSEDAIRKAPALLRDVALYGLTGGRASPLAERLLLTAHALDRMLEVFAMLAPPPRDGDA